MKQLMQRAQKVIRCDVTSHDVMSLGMHICREASLGRALSSPQQFGLWEVEGLGLVVAFRGTASQEDVIVDVNITPVPLTGSLPRGKPKPLD